MSYELSTKISYDQTLSELKREFRIWGVEKYSVNTFNEIKIELIYYKNDKPIKLLMGDQRYKKDNLRVLLLVIRAIRLNELRGFGEVIASHYKQIGGESAKHITDPYDVLKILRGTPFESIKAVYRSMVAKYHPDSKPSGDVEMFKRINEAFKAIEKEFEDDKNS